MLTQDLISEQFSEDEYSDYITNRREENILRALCNLICVSYFLKERANYTHKLHSDYDIVVN